jgi:hypothetical protein
MQKLFIFVLKLLLCTIIDLFKLVFFKIYFGEVSLCCMQEIREEKTKWNCDE